MVAVALTAMVSMKEVRCILIGSIQETKSQTKPTSLIVHCNDGWSRGIQWCEEREDLSYVQMEKNMSLSYERRLHEIIAIATLTK